MLSAYDMGSWVVLLSHAIKSWGVPALFHLRSMRPGCYASSMR